MEYKIVTSGSGWEDGSSYELSRRVNAEIERGWKPIGGVTVYQESNGHGMKSQFFQSMIRENKQTFLQKILSKFS